MPVYLKLFLAFVTLTLAACEVRQLESLSPKLPDTGTQTIFYSTQRNPEQTGRIFGEERFEKIHYGKIEVSIPPNHKVGQIEWQNSNPAPLREFAITDVQEIDTVSTFLKDVRASKVNRRGETLVFIHGYNTTAADAVFRLAQIQEDFDLKDPSVLFTWPSAGHPAGYVYDRDSVLFARDDLEAVLSDLTRNGDKVFIVAHSLGTHLTMETLRQARLKGNSRMLDSLSGVVLISPDIDLDLFRRQAAAVDKLPQPFLIFAARQDKALNLSSFLTGRKPRVGRLVSADALGRDDVEVIDFSDFATGRRLDHLVPVTSPTAISILRGILEVENSGIPNFSKYLTLPRSES